MTDPKQAEEFVAKTRVDTLAISVGTLHGLFKGKEKLDFPRIKQIRTAVKDVPLVLHGASGVTPASLRQAIISGITIFNLDTTLRLVFTEAVKKSLTKDKKIIDPRLYLNEARFAVKKEVGKYLEILSGMK